jgi:hypothetical protein
MLDSRGILKQILGIIRKLIELSLCNDQNFPITQETSSTVIVVNENSIHTSSLLKDLTYRELYDIIEKTKNYHIKMLDGAYIQFMYEFDGREVLRHRLGFYPSPYLEEFQNSPEIYEYDEIYADIVDDRIHPVPLRFDFDKQYISSEGLYHPTVHLTLGQYTNCRIPVSAPLSPYHFIRFILKHFYRTSVHKYYEELPIYSDCFSSTLNDCDRSEVYLNIPSLNS